MKRRHLLSLAAVGAAGIRVAHAQSAVPKPRFAVGDTWTFERNDGARSGMYQHTILTIDGDVMRVEQSVNGKPALVLYTDEGNRIYTGKDKRTSARWVAFPMEIGSRWESEYSSGQGKTAETAARVEERLNFQTRGGTFDAFRIKAKGNWYNQRLLPGIADGWLDQEYFYAPAVRRVVHFRSRYWVKHGVGSRIFYEDFWELLHHQLAG